MPFVPGFQNDVFISYSHIDNDPPINAKIGWVDIFEDILRKRLLVRCSRQIKIFRDPELVVLGEFSQQLADALSSTASLICILSNPYLESEWCLRELRHFIDGGGAERLVKVEKSVLNEISDPDVQALFAKIKDVLNCKFYEQIGNTDRYRDLMPDVKPEDIAACYDKIDLIAQDLTRALKKLRSAAISATPTAAAADHADDEPGQVTVYLAEATADLEKQRNDIRTELLQFNCRVLPDAPLPSDRDELIKCVREYLAQSKLSIHLLGANYGTPSARDQRSVPHIQYDLALDMARLKRLVQMVWTPEEIQQTEDRQAKLLEQVRNATPEFLRTKIEDFKSEIIKKINPANYSNPEQGSDGDQVNVSLFCHDDDRNAVGPLFNHLTLNEFFQVNLQSHTQLPPTTDGVLLYYGTTDEKWFVNSWKLIQRQSSTARNKPVVAKAIYAGQPSTPEKDLLQSGELLIIKNYGQFNPASLAPFVERIKVAKGDSR